IAAMAAGPGPVGATRVSSGRDLSCLPEVTGVLGALARQGKRVFSSDSSTRSHCQRPSLAYQQT
uniref:Uncharacterized protein n=1 Tax=Catharus ustulatus TaxID=91951 RepID=A0A8C3Y1K7_CATUS